MGVLKNKPINSKELLQNIDTLSETLAKNLSPASPHLKIVVIIPAKNEASHIQLTLQALLDQQENSGNPFNPSIYEILVLCHNCTDTTYDICQEFRSTNAMANLQILRLNSEIATTVGSARRILMNIAYSRIQDPQGLIVSTDADTIADPYWLNTLKTYIKKNVGLVCGFIKADYHNIQGQALKYLLAKDLYLMLQAQLESLLLPDPKNPWPRHNYNWGPNLAIKRDVYKKVGGISLLSFLEDVDLYNKVAAQGYVVKHCMDAIVTTSVRIHSRCDEGFGAELKVWSEHEGIPYCVEGLQKLKLRFGIYKAIHKYYENRSLPIFNFICKQAHFKKNTLAAQLVRFSHPGAMVIYTKQHLTTSQSWNSLHPNISVFEACQELETFFSGKALVQSVTVSAK